jgi:hypothetical protein
MRPGYLEERKQRRTALGHWHTYGLAAGFIKPGSTYSHDYEDFWNECPFSYAEFEAIEHWAKLDAVQRGYRISTGGGEEPEDPDAWTRRPDYRSTSTPPRTNTFTTIA